MNATHFVPAPGRRRNPASVVLLVSSLALVLAGAGCVSRPFGADQVSPRRSYQQVETSAINGGRLSAGTQSLLHRHNLSRLAADRPDEAVRRLHQKALAAGDRDLFFALAELSYMAAERIRASVKPWDPRDAREFHLGAAVYAYQYLFGEGDDKPSAFDRRFRTACDLYNYGLGWSLTERRGTNAVAELKSGKRRLPVGEIDVQVDASRFPWPLTEAEMFLLADQFTVHGLSVRNREPGVGTPLIAVGRYTEALRLHRTFPATVFLRLENPLADISAGKGRGRLEVFPGYTAEKVEIAGEAVPLERDLTVPAAYLLNQSFAWQVERLQFFKPRAGLKSQLIPAEPYQPGRIPLVFVHGTFSSPVWWAEMVNTLRADPVARQRYQIWQFLYSSSKPLIISATELRAALAAEVARLDPEARDPALRQMVLVGHSQGGLLCKLAVTDTGDHLWRVFSDRSPEELDLTPEQRDFVRRHVFLKPLPEVKRVVFISTPHRGSYLAGQFARNLTRRLVSLPGVMVQRSLNLFQQTEASQLPGILSGNKMPTSLDSMSPENPYLLTLAAIPTAPGVGAHSIISIKGDDQPPEGGDGVVKYKSAHVDYVESELVVRSPHSCQGKPETIEEVRRILHEHLKSLPPK